MPAVSIVVVSWNTRDLLRDCLDSVEQTAGDLDYEVFVVDNASADGSAAMIRERYPRVHLVVNDDNVGFARANNQALRLCRAPFALLLNSDARLLPSCLAAMLSLAESAPRAGAIGAQLLYPDGSLQGSHSRFPGLGQEALVLSGLGRLLHGPWYPNAGPSEDREPRVVDWVGGACLLVRRAAFEEVGGFDEGFFMYSEEVDLCLSLRKRGWQVWYQPVARAIHHQGGSTRHLRPQRERYLYRGRVRFFRKHYGDRAARLLALQIYGFTAAKIGFHGLLRALTRGRYGRDVTSLRLLRASLREALAPTEST